MLFRALFFRVAVFVVAVTAAVGCTDRTVVGAGRDAGLGDAGAGDAGPVDTGPPDAAPRDAPPADNTCAVVRLETTRTIPNVVIVIDRSGSMNLDFDAGRSRWVVLRDALLAAPGGLVTTLQSVVRFGVVMYSEDIEVAGCPDLAEERAALGSHPAITLMFSAYSPGGNTPSGQALASVLADIDRLAPVRADPTVIVFATDGEPATCEDGTDITAGRLLSIDAATAAYGAGIPTYVLSVGTEIAMTHLQDVANAGVGRGAGAPDAPFWVATDTTGLRDALGAIVTGVISCEVELEGTIDPSLACDGTVTLGADELECGTEWRAVDGTHIELLGPACDRLRRATTDELFGTFPCHVLI